jgi:high frequency lysogenization protein
MATMNHLPARTLGLAGLVQSASLTLQIARTGLTSSDALEAVRESLFQFDAASSFDIYQFGDGLAHGKLVLAKLLEEPGSEEQALINLAYQTLSIAKRFYRNSSVQRQVGAELHSALEAVQMLHDPAARAASLDARCALIYQTHIRPLGRTIIIRGEQSHLNRSENADRIRMLLLAGVRAGVLFYQMKGARWQLLLQRQQLRRQLPFI